MTGCKSYILEASYDNYETVLKEFYLNLPIGPFIIFLKMGSFHRIDGLNAGSWYGFMIMTSYSGDGVKVTSTALNNNVWTPWTST